MVAESKKTIAPDGDVDLFGDLEDLRSARELLIQAESRLSLEERTSAGYLSSFGGRVFLKDEIERAFAELGKAVKFCESGR